jgi:NDP-sugar pyrophosphorylase family protein
VAPLDGLILAAGLGTRLGEVGKTTPKALIEVGGRTMLEHVARRLVAAGAGRLVVNAHHHADRIEEWIAGHDLGVEVLVSPEPERPLETGGGLLQASRLFRPGSDVVLHNVDVLSDADLSALRRAHRESKALVTVAVSDRETPRRLVFDEVGLVGRVDDARGLRFEARPPRGRTREWAFTGIHLVSPDLPGLVTERGVFPILDTYLRLAAEGARILPHSIGRAAWYEVGTPERLAAARKAMGA